VCYDIKANLTSQLKTAKYYNDDPTLIGILEEKIRQLEITSYHHVSGFQHPRLPIVTNDEDRVRLATWGLLPFWMKDLQSGLRFYNKTLNARSETIFEKPSFRDAAKHKRCLVMVDGFYEHHHHNGKTYPFFIQRLDGTPFLMAGLWSTWKSKDATTVMDTFSIVTTHGNPLMARIHNNPKLAGPRMPVILPGELANEWLTTEVLSEHDKTRLIKDCCQPFDEGELTAHTVGSLRGKNRIGNLPEVTNEILYEYLDTYHQILEA